LSVPRSSNSACSIARSTKSTNAARSRTSTVCTASSGKSSGAFSNIPPESERRQQDGENEHPRRHRESKEGPVDLCALPARLEHFQDDVRQRKEVQHEGEVG